MYRVANIFLARLKLNINWLYIPFFVPSILLINCYFVFGDEYQKKSDTDKENWNYELKKKMKIIHPYCFLFFNLTFHQNHLFIYGWRCTIDRYLLYICVRQNVRISNSFDWNIIWFGLKWYDHHHIIFIVKKQIRRIRKCRKN